MSQIPSTTDPSSRFQNIYDKALEDYTKKTKKNLTSHPLFSHLNACDSADAILIALRNQIRDFYQPTNSNDRLTKWLDPVVHVLCTFSTTIGASVDISSRKYNIYRNRHPPLMSQSVKAVRASHGILADLFERIENFIKRLEAYTEVAEIASLTDIIAKVMAEVLSILAIATNEIERGVAKKFFNKLIGRTDIEDALSRLDKLTQDEVRMVAAQGLKAAHGIDDRMMGVTSEVQVVSSKVEGVDETLRVVGEQVNKVLNSGEETRLTVQQMTMDVCDLSRGQLREKLGRWLSPPDSSVNLNTACESQHEGTGVWFTQGKMFADWKESGSLLWIHGNPGSGKSVLCSAIIKDIARLSNRTLIAYYYFDFKEIRKQDVRALFSSFLVQICGQSDPCCDALRGLYSRHANGSDQPSVDALKECLEDMLMLEGQVPIYLVVDAVDECPDRGMPSSRGKVLKLLEALVNLRLPNLRLCVTSRPEMDIRTVFYPLASTCISLHNQSGQSKDIVDYITSVVHSMKNWREEDKELVIDSLSARAGGMFRWVFCQLESLRRCLARNVRRTLESLPATLDDTYMRILREIPEENRDDAHRLLQCLTVAVRPLRVEELAEMLAMEFPDGGIPKLREDWRWEDEEQAVLLACSSLVSIDNGNDDDDSDDEEEDDGDPWGSRVVQFSHFSVKEFLISDRLATLPAASHYRILPEPAHRIMAQACLCVLLRLDYNIDRENLQKFPLAHYAAKHWFKHAEFENVISHIGDGIDNLLDTDKPHFAAWLWMWKTSWTMRPDRPEAVPLYYIAEAGLRGLARYIISKHPEDVLARGGTHGTPLHVALHQEHIEISRLLLEHPVDVHSQGWFGETPLHLASRNGYYDIAQQLLCRGADMNACDYQGQTPLHVAADRRCSVIIQLLLEHGANADALDNNNATPLDRILRDEGLGTSRAVGELLKGGASVEKKTSDGYPLLHWSLRRRCLDIVRLLLDRGVDVNAKDHGSTPLHIASFQGDLEASQLLLQSGANVDVRNYCGETALHIASTGGNLEILRSLLDHGANINACDNVHSTALHLAIYEENVAAVRLLLEGGANVNLQNKDGHVPLHLASEGGQLGTMRLLLENGANLNVRNKSDLTPLELASRRGEFMAAQLLLGCGANVNLRNKDGQTPLHLVSWYGQVHIMQLFLQHGAHVDAQDNDRSTPLHLASYKGKLDAARLLLQWSANVNVRTNDGRTPLHYASQGGYFEIIESLLGHGVNVNAWDQAHLTPLHLALREGEFMAAQLLLGRGANVNLRNKDGHTPLHLASWNRQVQLMQLFLQHGAQVGTQDNDHSTPLHLASYKGELDAARVLIQWGANVNVQTDDGRTPLHYASQGGHFEIMGLLLCHGADVMARDNERSTPLHLATDKGRVRATKLLLKHGARVHVQNNKGESPFQIASAGAHGKVARILVNHVRRHCR